MNSNTDSILPIVSYHCFTETIELLLNHNFKLNINKINNDGDTP